MQFKTFWNEHKIQILLVGIVLVSSFFWRFVNYEERWTLSQDQARDAIIGIHMVQNFELPLVGPPSSAGSFSFGPYYYWFIALFMILIPLVNGPWIGFTLVSTITPLIFFFIGKHFGGKIAGLLFGLIAAFSSELIFHSSDLLNPIPLSFIVSLLFLFVIKLVDEKKIKFAVNVGFIIGLAINFHLQSLGLLTLIPLISYFNHFSSSQKIKVFGLAICGLFISFIPLLTFNFLHQNILLSNIFSFIFGGQTSSGIESNLFTDIFIFWPKLWGTTIAHLPLLGYGFILLFLLALVYATGNFKNLSKSFYVIGITFLFQIIFLFVYQGVRSPIYLIVFHSFFIFFGGWIILNLYQMNKYFGITILFIVLALTVPANLLITKDNGSQISTILSLKNQIDRKAADVLLLSDQNSSMLSLPLYYLYAKGNRISENGMHIILCENKLVKDSDGITEKWSCPLDVPVIAEEKQYKVYESTVLSEEQKNRFNRIKSEEVYSWLENNYKIK